MNIAIQFKGPKYTTGAYWYRNLKSLGHEVKRYKKYDITKDHDLIIRVDDAYPDVSNFQGANCLKVLIATDTHNDGGKRLLRIGENFDLIFFPQKQGMQVFQKAGYDPDRLYYLPNAGDEIVHRKVAGKKKYDLAIIGGDYVSPIDHFSRKDFFDMVRTRYPNSFVGRCDYRKMGKVYSRAKVGLNVAAGDVNMRNFEIAAAGTMLLTEQVNEIENFESLFRKGIECDIYRRRDWDHMFAKIDYYLNHEAEREQIASRGHRRFLKEHTYKHRIQHLLEVVANYRSQG